MRDFPLTVPVSRPLRKSKKWRKDPSSVYRYQVVRLHLFFQYSSTGEPSKQGEKSQEYIVPSGIGENYPEKKVLSVKTFDRENSLRLLLHGHSSVEEYVIGLLDYVGLEPATKPGMQDVKIKLAKKLASSLVESQAMEKSETSRTRVTFLRRDKIDPSSEQTLYAVVNYLRTGWNVYLNMVDYLTCEYLPKFPGGPRHLKKSPQWEKLRKPSSGVEWTGGANVVSYKPPFPLAYLVDWHLLPDGLMVPPGQHKNLVPKRASIYVRPYQEDKDHGPPAHPLDVEEKDSLYDAAHHAFLKSYRLFKSLDSE
jgi:hypothetical protein